MFIDLHCDLLGCVEDKKTLTFESPETNCSVFQLRDGKLAIQTLAVAAITKRNSSKKGAKQIDLYQKLLQDYKTLVAPFSEFVKDSHKTHFLLAVENASSLIEEDEPLDLCFSRLDNYQSVEKFLYASLTWNCENRFGGGNASEKGLKDDGRVFLEYLSGQNIAIDLSHTSDALAYDILNTIDKNNYTITPIASHSNYRAITNVKRNLPDELVKEIIKRKGLIGLNFVRRFVGDSKEDFIKHLEHGLKLGALETLCLGADFYGGMDIPKHLLPDIEFPTFQEGFNDSSKTPLFLDFIEKNLSKEVAMNLGFNNAFNYLQREGFLKT